MPLDQNLRFGEFVLDRAARELRRNDEIVRLQDLPIRLLLALAERPGTVLTRTELREHLWGADTFVDFEAGLNTAIAKLRDALADDAEHPQYIETLPRRGYRFIGQLETAPVVSPVPMTASPVERPRAQRTRYSAPFWLAAGGLVVATMGSLWLATTRAAVPIAVVLFDNETGESGLDLLAQQFTDAAVLKLTARPSLAVIGNAQILRTSRPFRDISAIRDALHVQYVIIGQLQRTDDGLRALAHLIRTDDQTHLWVDRLALPAAGQSATVDELAARIDRAVKTKVLGQRD